MKHFNIQKINWTVGVSAQPNPYEPQWGVKFISQHKPGEGMTIDEMKEWVHNVVDKQFEHHIKQIEDHVVTQAVVIMPALKFNWDEENLDNEEYVEILKRNRDGKK